MCKLKKDRTIDVVIPYFNAGHTLGRALESVFSQTLLPNNIIIVDDCSDDYNKKLLQVCTDSYASQDIDIIVIRLDENAGAGNARNIGIQASDSFYIAFLDSDDVWHSDKLRVQSTFMDQNKLAITGHGYIFDLNVEKFTYQNTHLVIKNISKYLFAITNPFFTPTVMVMRLGFKNFDPNFRRVDDYKCWLENYSEGKVKLINQKLAGGFKQPIGDSGLTGSIMKMHISYIRVLLALYAKSDISIMFVFIAILVEYLKLPVRYFKVFIRKNLSL